MTNVAQLFPFDSAHFSSERSYGQDAHYPGLFGGVGYAPAPNHYRPSHPLAYTPRDAPPFPTSNDGHYLSQRPDAHNVGLYRNGQDGGLTPGPRFSFSSPATQMQQDTSLLGNVLDSGLSSGFPPVGQITTGGSGFASSYPYQQLALSIPNTTGNPMAEFPDSSGFGPSRSSATPSPSLPHGSPSHPTSTDSYQNSISLQNYSGASSDTELTRTHSSSTSSPSPTSSGNYVHQGTGYPTRGTVKDSLPFPEHDTVRVIMCNGQEVQPNIAAKVEKNFFMLEGEPTWTCYRRNYISVETSYTLSNITPNGWLYVTEKDDTELGHVKGGQRIQALAMSLCATSDTKDGKAVELIQHTPKRDKGPQNPIEIQKVDPQNVSGTISYDTHPPRPHLPFQQDDEDHMSSIVGSVPTQNSHLFERVQFKSATSNNGRRRAQQQYYHLIVVLYADIREDTDCNPRWVPIARRISAPMVVRGRSPGHYSKDSTHCNESSGSGGHGGGSRGVSGMRSRGYSGDSASRRGYTNSYSSSFGSHNYNMRNSQGWRQASNISLAPRTDDTIDPPSIQNVKLGPTIEDAVGYKYYPVCFSDHLQQSSTSVKPEDIFDPSKPIKDANGNTKPFVSGNSGYLWHPHSCGLFTGFDTSQGRYPDLRAGF